MDVTIDYWRTADGLYDIREGRYVTDAPDESIIAPLYSDTSDANNLILADKAKVRETLVFYGWPIGKELFALHEIKDFAFSAIKGKRLAVEYAGPLVMVEGRPLRFPSEVKDETRLNSLAGLFMADPTAQIPDWKVADGVYVTMTAPLLEAVKAAGFARIAITFSVERQKRAEVEALGTTEAVQAWLDNGELDTGWPE